MLHNERVVSEPLEEEKSYVIDLGIIKQYTAIKFKERHLIDGNSSKIKCFHQFLTHYKVFNNLFLILLNSNLGISGPKAYKGY